MEVDRQIQRALVTKATLRDDDYEENPLAEISSLARTAGAEVVGSVQQRLVRPHPATYLGKGKVEEIAARAEELEADVIIADNDLSPAQARNLEKVTSRTVIDRSELIMDIFSQRACTPQARLQVELAQLRYSLPRLKRLWTHLSRYQGGIGMRGPGEKQLEEDKRLIRRRIQLLTRKLKRLEGKNETAAAQRESEFVIALVGYTNTGKSTLLNRLTGSEELVEDKLFATLDTRIRRWTLAKNRHVLLTDTVGFIKHLPHHLVASFHATLADAQNANILFHVVDAASPSAESQMDTVRRVLRELNCQGKETWIVFNKWDKVPEERLIDARFLEETLLPREREHVVRVSAHSGQHLDELAEATLERLKREERTIDLEVPHARGDVVAFIQQNGRILEQDYRSEGIVLKAALSRARMAKLKSLFPEGFEPRPKESWEA
jgi:GTP-binding protein HflX